MTKWFPFRMQHLFLYQLTFSISTDLFNKHIPLYAYVTTCVLLINNMWIHVTDKWKLKTPDQLKHDMNSQKPRFIAIIVLFPAKVNSKLSGNFLDTIPLSKLEWCNMNVPFTSGHQFSSTFYSLLSLLSSILWIGSCSAKFPWDNFWL